MSPISAAKTLATAERAISDVAADISRRASAVSDQAWALGEAANAAVDDSMRATKRAFTIANRRMQDAADLRDDVVYRVKRSPLTSVGLAFGVGILAGVATSVVSRRSGRPAVRPVRSVPGTAKPV